MIELFHILHFKRKISKKKKTQLLLLLQETFSTDLYENFKSYTDFSSSFYEKLEVYLIKAEFLQPITRTVGARNVREKEKTTLKSNYNQLRNNKSLKLFFSEAPTTTVAAKSNYDHA